MNRKALNVVIIVITLFAVGTITIPFVGSLSPNIRSVENASALGIAIDLADIPPGTYLEKSGEYARYFVLRDFDGEIYVYEIKYYGDAYRLPDMTWNRPFTPCVHFGPEALGKSLKEDGKIRCHDHELSDWSRQIFLWEYTGKNVSGSIDDMPIADFEIRDGILLIKGTYWPLSDIEPGES